MREVWTDLDLESSSCRVHCTPSSVPMLFPTHPLGAHPHALKGLPIPEELLPKEKTKKKKKEGDAKGGKKKK